MDLALRPRNARILFVTIASAALGLTLASASAQNPITWTVRDIVDHTDVSTRGAPCIAVNMGPEVCESVVNGVHFQADRSHWTRKILVRGGTAVSGVMYFPAWTSGGYTLTAPYNRTAPNIGARHTTEPEYDAILKDGRHSSPGTWTVTCSVSGLTPGNSYEIQIFYGNATRPTRITEWDDGLGAPPGAGGIYLAASGPHFGQVATGVFTADASGTQTFSNYQHPVIGSAPETNNACSAIQVRELTPGALVPRATYYGEGTPGTNTQPNLGGTSCSPGIAFVGHPRIGAAVLLTIENSQDVASTGVLVVGLAPASLPILGGTLLVTPASAFAVPIPQPATPYVHDHELQIPLTVPVTPGVALYFQALELDPNAPGGFWMTPGMKVEIGV
ncbi:MAG: hypothetical protein IPM29_01860 [Planctomycetes bacterium]|nr:hypothetical protein [Planctomycetota bacterium]